MKIDRKTVLIEFDPFELGYVTGALVNHVNEGLKSPDPATRNFARSIDNGIVKRMSKAAEAFYDG